MRKTLLFLLVILTLLAFAACNTSEPSTTTYNVTLQQNKADSIATNLYGIVENFSIVIAPEHADSISIFRTDNAKIYIYYLPDSAYTGEDYIKVGAGHLRWYGTFKSEDYYEFNISIEE